MRVAGFDDDDDDNRETRGGGGEDGRGDNGVIAGWGCGGGDGDEGRGHSGVPDEMKLGAVGDTDLANGMDGAA